MSWKIEERNGRFAVLGPSGTLQAEHATKAVAEAHLAAATKDASFDDIRQQLQAWANQAYPPQKSPDGYMTGYAWVREVYADRFIYSREDEAHCYQRSYALVGGELTVGDTETEVRETWEPVKSADTLVFAGGAVKALGGGKVGGYLVRFSTEADPDTSEHRDFFTAETDFDVELAGAKTAVYYHHGLDDTLRKKRLARGTMKADDVGVWVEAQLSLRDEWEKAVYALAEAGKLGWSSGTATHLVEREPVLKDGKTVAHRITHWPLGLDASLTTTPAEPRCQATALKSISVPSLAELAEGVKHVSRERLVPGTLTEHSEAVVSANAEYAARLAERLDARVKAGRVLSKANIDELEAVLSSLDGVAALRDRVSALLEKARPKDTSQPDAEAKTLTERLRTEHLRLQTQGVFA